MRQPIQSVKSLRLFGDAATANGFCSRPASRQVDFWEGALKRRSDIPIVDGNHGGFAVPKFLKRFVLLGVIFAAPHVGRGADHEFPTLNSIGRFWGLGYTQGGYQTAQDGRFDIVTNRHRASNYRSGGLAQYSQPLYSPTLNSLVSPAQIVAPTPAALRSDDQSQALKKSEAKPDLLEVVSPPMPSVPTKPAGPSPRWLEDYLQEETTPEQGPAAPRVNRYR
ncbi:MAG: hypothetical protein ABI557_04125 [Aureliella sp.]